MQNQPTTADYAAHQAGENRREVQQLKERIAMLEQAVALLREEIERIWKTGARR